jgi:hypothetical protein
MSLDLDRITHPLRLAQGSHQPGSGKGCAMNVISYINGDTKITDFPECSARPLARMVQSLNDRLAGSDGYLSPENSVLVLDLGWLTVGTAGTPREAVWQWLADILVDPERGVVKYARPVARWRSAVSRRCVCVRPTASVPTVTEWREARAAAAAAADAAAAAYAAAYAAAAAAYAAAADAYARIRSRSRIRRRSRSRIRIRRRSRRRSRSRIRRRRRSRRRSRIRIRSRSTLESTSPAGQYSDGVNSPVWTP